jgi:hypothetical protein
MGMAEEQQQLPVGNPGIIGNVPHQAAALPKAKAFESIYYSVISQTTADGRIMIGQDIEIFPAQPCNTFVSPGAKAFEAKDRRLSGEQFAVLCGRSSVPRVTMVASYKTLKSAHIMKLLEAGIINWPPEKRQRFALIFDKPAGKKILESPEAKPFAIAEDKLMHSVIQPALAVLSELRNIDFVHGAINAENVFMVGQPGLETIVLGECLSAAPSFWQHPLYEIAPRAMAKHSGRGPGTFKDDLYALGVCVAILARGENILLGKTPQQVIEEKIEHGSYGAIVGRARIPGSVAEFLRGVLNDDDDVRWDLDDANRWLEGRRMTPNQPRVDMKTSRALIFRDKKYTDLRTVADAFASNVEEAVVEIEKGQFETWLKRNFADKGLKLRVENAWEREKTTSHEKMIASVCAALDPYAPVRYRGQAIFPMGLGTVLAEAMAKNEDIQVYGEMITQQLLSNWVTQRFDEIPDSSGMMSRLEKSRMALTQRIPGYGMERVLYLLSPEAPCLSPILRDYFIFVPGTLLLALEVVSRMTPRPSVILDRHMIAFISVKEPRMIDQQLSYLSSPDIGKQMIGVLRTLAAIQRRFATGPVPGIFSWLVSMTPPLIELIHNHDLRQDMTRQVNRMTGSGNLEALLEVLDDRLLIQDDANRFEFARREYRAISYEKREIENYLRKRKGFGRATGRQVAMIFSCLLSVSVIAIYAVLRLRGF